MSFNGIVEELDFDRSRWRSGEGIFDRATLVEPALQSRRAIRYRVPGIAII